MLVLCVRISSEEVCGRLEDFRSSPEAQYIPTHRDDTRKDRRFARIKGACLVREARQRINGFWGVHAWCINSGGAGSFTPQNLIGYTYLTCETCTLPAAV